MRVINLMIEVTNDELDALEAYFGGHAVLRDELEEAVRTRLRELRELIEPDKEEESDSASTDY